MKTHSSYPAPVWRRIAALVYDTLIMLAISFLYGIIATILAVRLGSKAEDYRPMINSPFFFLGWILCLLAFYCWFWHKSGQTLGMRTWRLKLIQNLANEQTPTWRQCFVRSIITPPLVLLGGIAYWFQWFNQDKNCLQDKLTNTRVIIVDKNA